jgi:fructose-1,6-bisphosphatase/inositol monophosphatase family enzyme
MAWLTVGHVPGENVTVDVDAVTNLILDVSREVVMPRFQTLRDDEIQRKATAEHVDDIVTIVDREAEARLSGGLQDLLPSAWVLGEEAAFDDEMLLRRVEDDRPVWVIDPLDGTSNFAAGHDGFGIMVSLAARGHVSHAWVYLPARGDLFVAEAAGGAYRNGVRIRVPTTDVPAPRAALFLRYMPSDIREMVMARTAGRVVVAAHSGAAAIEYTNIVRGDADLAIYYRLLPWDHGAPALVLTESGGVVQHLDGTPYTIRSRHQITLVARDAELAARARAWLTER